MVRPTPQMDPDVVGLLRELSEASPELFFGDRTTSLASDLLGKGRVPRPASALARAVGDVMDEAARRQAAEVLKYVATEIFVHDSAACGRITLRSSEGGQTLTPGVRTRADSDIARGAAENSLVQTWFRGEAGTVCAFFVGTPSQGVRDSVRLLSRAIHLAPTLPMRNSYAMALQLSGHPRSALTILRALQARGDHPSLNAMVQANIGLALSSMGHHSRAAGAYRVHSCQNAGWIPSASAWLLNAVQAGDTQSAAEAARMIDENHSGVRREIESAAQVQRQSRLAGLWSPTSVARVTLRALDSSLGHLSRIVTDALD